MNGAKVAKRSLSPNGSPHMSIRSTSRSHLHMTPTTPSRLAAPAPVLITGTGAPSSMTNDVGHTGEHVTASGRARARTRSSSGDHKAPLTPRSLSILLQSNASHGSLRNLHGERDGKAQAKVAISSKDAPSGDKHAKGSAPPASSPSSNLELTTLDGRNVARLPTVHPDPIANANGVTDATTSSSSSTTATTTAPVRWKIAPAVQRVPTRWRVKGDDSSSGAPLFDESLRKSSITSASSNAPIMDPSSSSSSSSSLSSSSSSSSTMTSAGALPSSVIKTTSPTPNGVSSNNHVGHGHFHAHPPAVEPPPSTTTTISTSSTNGSHDVHDKQHNRNNSDGGSPTSAATVTSPLLSSDSACGTGTNGVGHNGEVRRRSNKHSPGILGAAAHARFEALTPSPAAVTNDGSLRAFPPSPSLPSSHMPPPPPFAAIIDTTPTPQKSPSNNGNNIKVDGIIIDPPVVPPSPSSDSEDAVAAARRRRRGRSRSNAAGSPPASSTVTTDGQSNVISSPVAGSDHHHLSVSLAVPLTSLTTTTSTGSSTPTPSLPSPSTPTLNPSQPLLLSSSSLVE
jgi:hypothetical protein